MKLVAWLVIIALDIPNALLRGFVLSRLWHWFMVPLGVREVGIALAIGISLLVGLIARNPYAAESDEDEAPMTKAVTRQFGNVLVSLIAWGFGAIVATFL